MYKDIDWAMVLGVLDLTDFLELIVDRFNQGSLPQADLGGQFNSLSPKEIEELVVEVAAITKEIAEESLCNR